MIMNEHGFCKMDSFEFQYGRVLNDVEVEYATYGTPIYDDEGYIVNAVLFFSTFKGTYSFLSNSQEYINSNSDLLSKLYCIDIRSLGTPGSCSPSTTGLNYDFPNYTCLDAVNFKRQFIAEKFKIKKIKGLIGEGIGGFQVLTWACEYPDEMDCIFLVNTAAKTSGYRFILGKTFEHIIDSVEDLYSDEYSISKNKALIAINSLLFAHSASKKAFSKLDNNQIHAIFDDFLDEGLFVDIYDFKFRNECDLQFDVIDKLHKIKAKSLFVATNKNYFDYDLDLMPFKDCVKDSVTLIQDQGFENYFFEQEDYSYLGDEVISFFKNLEKE